MKTEWHVDDTRDGVTFRLLLEGEELGNAEIKSNGPAKPKAVWMMGARLARVGEAWAAFDNPVDLWESDDAPPAVGVRCAASHRVERGKHYVTLSDDPEVPLTDDAAFTLAIKAKVVTGFWIEGSGAMTPAVMETVGWFLSEVATRALKAPLGADNLCITETVAELLTAAKFVADDLGFNTATEDE